MILAASLQFVRSIKAIVGHACRSTSGVDINKATSEADLESSISNFQLAIAKDPQSGLAYSGLAVAYAALADFYRAPKEVMPKAKEAAIRALHLDETLSEAHDALGWVEFAYEWNWPLAEQNLKRRWN